MRVPVFRDCKAWKDDKLELSTASNRAAKLLDAAVHQLVGWYENDEWGGLMGTCDRMLEADQNFVMAKIFLNGLKLIGTGDSMKKDPTFAKDIDDLCYRKIYDNLANCREKMHIEAIRLFSEGKWQKAAAQWEVLLIDYPKDVLALKLAHDTYFYLGYQTQIRDSVARVLPHFSKLDPYYGYLKGMLSFGQEETNLFGEAEKSAQEALSINKNDAWATHSMAHIYEMEGRFEEGLKFMSNFESNWEPCGLLACHLYWHWSLYAIEKGDHDEVLRLYDTQISKRSKSGAMLDLIDCSSLLYRMKLEGINVQDRWQDALELCRPHFDDQIMFFNDIHFSMAFLSDESDNLSLGQRKLIEAELRQNKSTTYNESSSIGLAILDALQSYQNGHFEETVEKLYPIKHKIVLIGGSNAQRDVFNQLLIRACLSSTDKHHQNLARNLLYERKSLKPNSPLTDRLMAKLLVIHQ